MKETLLSVIIPVYGTERWLRRCLESVVRQTYRNIEIICVNDKSPDGCAGILAEYAALDPRIRVVNHEENRGLFQARISGLESARGDLIAFLDSDDYVTLDWYRVLVKRSLEEDSDMTLGNTVNLDENDNFFIYNNYRSLTRSHETLSSEELIRKFFDQEGNCFIWHTVWNKIYTARLIRRALPHLKELTEHTIMAEDIAFSGVFYCLANKLAFCDCDAYFYFRHGEASTSLTLPRQKILKNLQDLCRVFQFVESFLKKPSIDLYSVYGEGFLRFKERYFRIWSSNIRALKADNDSELVSVFLDGFGKKRLGEVIPHEFYFYELTSPWSYRYQSIKDRIVSEEIDTVSFDVFDTLLVRPLFDPKDLFLLVAEECSELLEGIDGAVFRNMRLVAEDSARRLAKALNPSVRDITLGEIYQSFELLYHVSRECTETLRRTEEALELRYCSARRSAKELFELAKYAGKRVVLVSDMYLEQEMVEKILEKNGYSGYEKLYLSSEEKRLKADGTLFAQVIRELKLEPSRILHIGDNWNSDVVVAGNKGLRTAFFPNTRETFLNGISDIFTGELTDLFTQNRREIIDTKGLTDQLPIRCMLAVVANEMFDNPFAVFQKNSDFNGDAYYIGYFALGMHLFGLSAWLDRMTRENYERLHFLARDGFVVKQAFDIWKESYRRTVDTSYVHATRKALLPFVIERAEDLYGLESYLNIYAQTPRQIMRILEINLRPLTPEAERQYRKRGIQLDEKFGSTREFYAFTNALVELSYDPKSNAESRAEMKSYFSDLFGERDAAFDIGYSGRIQTVLCKLCGKPVDALYLHDNGYTTNEYARKHGFRVQSFYPFSPAMTSVVREYLISEPFPSCVGYRKEGKNFLPVFSAPPEDEYATTYAVREMQKGGIQFCRKMAEIFGGHPMFTAVRPMDASAVWEHFLLRGREFDRYVFSNAVVEDEVYGGYAKKSLFDIWNWHLSQLKADKADRVPEPPAREGEDAPGLPMPASEGRPLYFLQGKAKWKKAVFYFFFDRKTFHVKYREHREKRKRFRRERKAKN